jgi:hypothetical protein
MTDEQVVVGEVEAGRAASVKRAINKLISGVNQSTFDLAEKLYEVKTNQYFTAYGYESFSKFVKDLAGLKYSKGFYLVKICSLMAGAAVSREQYEPVGLTKLRAISKLSLEGEFAGEPMPLVVRELTLKAAVMEYEQVVEEVNKILGLTEDESMVWLNFSVKKSVRDLVILPAIELAIKHMPESQTTDDEGNHIDPSKGAAMECICADFLSSPTWNPDVQVDASGPEAELPDSVEDTGLDPSEQI